MMILIDICDWVHAINESLYAIIVEGPNDEKALRDIGITNHIYQLSKQGIFETCVDIAKNHAAIIILTDFDKEGKLMYGKLKTHFEKLGVKADTEFRGWLQANIHISHIEGISTYITKR